MEVSQIENAIKGDVYAFHYTVRGWGKESQIATLVNKIDTDPRWKVISYDWKDPKLIIKIEIIVNPFPLLIIVGVIGAISTGLFVYLSLDKVEKITESPVMKFGFLGIVLIALFIGYKTLKI